MIGTITATQVYNFHSPIVRATVSDLTIFKFRHYADLGGIVESLAASIDNKVTHNIHKQTTAELYAFLYVNLTAKDVNNMFWINFEMQITVDEHLDDEPYFNQPSQPTPDNLNPNQLHIEDL